MIIESYRDGRLHRIDRIDGQTIVIYKFWTSGQCQTRAYYQDGQLHKDQNHKDQNHKDLDLGPALITWYDNGWFEEIVYSVEGNCSRLKGPARQSWYNNGRFWQKEYHQQGRRHRDSKLGPAKLFWDDDGIMLFHQYWYKGQLYHQDSAKPEVEWWHKSGRLWIEEYWHNGQLQDTKYYKDNQRRSKWVTAFIDWIIYSK